MLKTVDILTDGEEPIVVSGLGDDIKIPAVKNSGEGIEIKEGEIWTFSLNPEVMVPLVPGIYSFDSIKTICAYYIKAEIVPKYIEEDPDAINNIYVVYEIWADYDKKMIHFDVEIDGGDIEMDLENDEENKTNTIISNLISYERKRVIKA